MRIAVVGKCQYSMFSGSQANATISVAEAIKLQGHDVYILSNDKLWWDDVNLLKSEWEKKMLLIADVVEPFDIAFEVGHMFETGEERRRIARKSIYVSRKHAAIDEIEHSLFPTTNAKRCWESVSEIWAFDAFCNSDDIQILETISRLPVYIVPYLWTPTIIEKHREETKSPHWLQLTQAHAQDKPQLPWIFHIAETNTTSTSSCTIPTLIMRETMLRKKITVKTLNIHNADHIYKSKFFQDNVWRHARVDDLSGVFVGRQRVVDWVFEPMSCVITHQRFNPFRPMLLDLAWVGIPFIHNSEFIRDISNGLQRFYYKDNRLSEGVEALERMNEDFIAKTEYFRIESINSIRKILLEKVSPFSNSTYNIWSKNLSRISNNVVPVMPISMTGMPAGIPGMLPVRIPVGMPLTASVTASIAMPVPQITVVGVQSPPDSITVGFCDMWSDFNPSYNFFTLLLEEACKHVTPTLTITGVNLKVGDKPPNLIVFGPFGTTWKTFDASIPKAHFTGENTPPINAPGVGLNMCFPHLDMTDETYLRLPLWILEIDWFGADPDKIVNPKPIPIDRCTKTYPEELEAKKKFCAFIVSNPGNPVRNAAFEWISDYKKVDSAGSLYNNVGPILAAGPGGGGGELKKLEFLKDYKFCITYENSSSAGYVTEKLLHAKAAGCIPIYWGDPKVNRDFNPAGFINAKDCKTPAELVEEVARIDKDDELWKRMAAHPALDAYKLEWTRRTLSQCAGRLLSLALKKSVALPRYLGASTTAEADAMRPKKNNDATTPVLVTFVTRRFLPSLQLWITAVNAQKKVLPDLEVRVYYGDDVPDETIARITETYSYISFHKLPDLYISTFKDIWDPQHYAWKIWIYYTLSHDVTFKNRMIFYMDAGCFMCRWPSEWLQIAKKNDICFLEDPDQTNDQWCHETFCNILNVTEKEKKEHQVVAGILIFRAGSVKVMELFETAWAWAQKRDVIAGEKWSGRLSDGRPFGHRHDQSILSILSNRRFIARYPLYSVYCDKSLRETFNSGRSVYCHRGDFKTSKQFTDGIDECYIINLDRRTDRMERLYTTTPSLKDRAKRFSAVEGKNLTLTPALARLFRPHDFLWKKAIMGCALSHLSLWWKLANEHQDIKSFLILEDDVKLKPEWEDRWRKAKDSLPDEWDIIYLGGILPPNRAGFETCKDKVNEYFSRVGTNDFFGQKPANRYFHWCAYSYVLSRSGAEKVLDVLMSRDGYWTSADHMMCNLVDKLNMYFLDPLVSGCYQDEDPKYANSAFNDFSRVDTFDSDLWNNDERFSKEQVDALTEETKDAEIDIGAALKDAALNPINPIAKPPTKFKHRLVCLAEHNLDISLLYEKEWIYELFGKPALLPIDIVHLTDPPPLDETPIVILQRPLTTKYTVLLDKWSEAGAKFYILHLSDEHCTDDISSYTLPGCLKVVRTYDRRDFTEEQRAKCLIIPLGYHWTLRGGGCPYPIERTPRLPFRGVKWSFFGTNWNKRSEKFAPIMNFEPHRRKLLEEWNSHETIGYEEYIGVLLDTIYVPCPGGNNPETYRFYEALECGCVPILVREAGDEMFVKMITDNLPILPTKSWDEASLLMRQLYDDKKLLESYRLNILNAWRLWKLKLCGDIKSAFNLTS